MILLAILVSTAAIGILCWLLFTLAVFALPLFVGVTAGSWGYETGAGWLGAIVIGFVAAVLALGIGQLLITVARSTWMKLAVAAVFVAPAVVAGYHAVHGIMKHTVPSEAWATIFSVVGAIAVGFTAFLRVAGMAATGPSDPSLARV